MHIGSCYYCKREVEFKLLKRCGACKAVTYCSRGCQKKAWKLSHKYNCYPSSLPAGEEALLKPHAKIVSAWQNKWKNTLDAFAVLALDLEKNPGKNATHCMWLELKYTGREANSEKFKIICAALRTTEEILAETPQLHLMREQPTLTGKQVRYVTIFCFEEEGKPLQTFYRARSLVLSHGLDGIEALRGQPAGWEVVSMAVQQLFGSPDEPMMVFDAPVGR